MIEKAFKRSPQLDTEEIVFEYAMCLECAERMRATLSQESKMRVDSYLLSHYFVDRDEPADPEKLIQHRLKNCWITGEETNDLREYHIMGLCHEGHIHADQVMCIGGEALDQIQEMLSAKTKDELDRYIDDLNGLPPEWQEALFNRKVVLL